MGEKAATDVARAVAPWGGAGHAVCLARLPRERRSVHITVFLTFGGQRAAGCAAVRCVLPCHVTLAVAAWHWTPKDIGHSGRERAHTDTHTHKGSLSRPGLLYKQLEQLVKFI